MIREPPDHNAALYGRNPRPLQKHGTITGFACLENQGGKTYEQTPYYANRSLP